MGGVTLNASVTAKSAVPLFSFPLFSASPQAPFCSFALGFFFALGYFARPLDYPERDCLQSNDKRTISSAKSRSSSFVVNFHLIPVFPSCKVFFITQSTTSRNSKPDMLQPCFTPVLILNHSVVSWPSTTAH